MPYKRYDLTNKYNRKGRRVSENLALKRFYLFATPLLIIFVILLGIFISIKVDERSRPKVTQPDVSQVETETGNDVLLRIVSSARPLEADYIPDLVEFGNVRIAKVAYEDVEKLISDASSAGINISVSRGFVSYDEQSSLYNETFATMKNRGYSEIKAESETKKICPEAGCSENQTGLLLTFSTTEEGDFVDTEAGKWLSKFCVNYGFVLRYPEGDEGSTGMSYAPDVYRYVGKDNALNMRRYDMTLEAYSYHVNIK